MHDLNARGLAPPVRRPAFPTGATQSVALVLDRWLAEDPDRLALVGRSGRLSYAAIDRAANRAAGALAALSVGAGDRVAACLPNDLDIVVAFLGALRLGAIWVGVNRPLAAREKAYLLRDSGARVVLLDADLHAADELAPMRGDLGELEHVVCVDPADPGAEWSRLLAAADGAARPAGCADRDPFGPAAIAYTSGTTGFPKGAVHSHHNLLLPGAVTAWRGEDAQTVTHGVVLPLSILNLMVLGPLTAFQVGSTCVAMDRIDPVGLAEWVERERIGHFAAVPTILHDLLTSDAVRQESLTSLVRPMVGGADCPEELRSLIRERFGMEVGIGYGMTEAPTAVTTSGGARGDKPGLCGTALPQIEIRICDDDGREVPAGEPGEICVAPARTGVWAGVYTPMLGYWDDVAATREALRDGVYRTGDIGFLEADGALYIRGRRNELILRGGANVYPAEVERVLTAHPAVASAAVFGLPDERLGERVVAVVSLVRGGHVAPEVLIAHCRGELARYKTPEEIRIVDTMPRNAMNKIVKARLHALFDAPGPPGESADPPGGARG